MLLEAGPDTPPGREPADIRDSYPGAAYFSGRYHWNDLRVAYDSWAPGDNRAPMIRRYEQARILGGGSSINGMFAVRGLKSDYDAWAGAGATGWGFDDVLPYLKKLERDTDFPDAPRHGADGPIPIRRIPRHRWPGFSRALDDALVRRGHARLDDGNGTDADGVFPFALTNWPDQRVSTAMANLTPQVRARPNLDIVTGARVLNLMMDGRTAIGARIMRDGDERLIMARRTVICAGVFHSPPILMRAGIGPAEHLAEHGIPVLADRPGVGAHLQDHASTALAFHLRRDARIDPAARRHIFAGVRYSSGHPGCPPGDMFLTIVNRAGWHPLGAAMGSILLTVNRAFADGGTVRLASADPMAEPDVTMRFFSDRRDLDRLTAGYRMVAELIADPAVAATWNERFPSTYGEKARDLARKTFKTWWQTLVARNLMDASAMTRRWAMERLIHPPASLEEVLASEVSLEDWTRENAFSGWHAAGTCRMGAPENPRAVVDPQTRVIGVEGLHVADASIMPSVVSGNTNLTTIMIGEKTADLAAAALG